MPLSKKEFISWQQIVAGLTDPNELDPIEQAARDLRVVRATRYLLSDAEPFQDQKDLEYSMLLMQVGHEYMLEVEEVGVATSIAADRIIREHKS